MGTFKDIMDAIAGVEGDVASVISNRKQQKLKSLSKGAMEGILNFPMIVPKDASLEDTMLICKAAEKEFASFTLVVMSMNPYLNTMGGTPTAGKYIKQFHQNINSKSDPTDLVNMINAFTETVSRKYGIEYEKLSELQDNICYHIFENVNVHKLNALNIKYNYTIEDITEAQILNNKYIDNSCFSIIPIKEDNDTYQRGSRPVVNNTSAPYANSKFDFDVDSDVYKMASTDAGDVNVRINGGLNSKEVGRALAQGVKNGIASKSNPYGKGLGLSDNDVKKANELVPTMISMRIYPYHAEEKTELPPIDVMIGIKATIHPVSSEEIIQNIVRGIKNQDKFFNFIRWTTGEVQFFKDFLFSINEIKLDAINSGIKSSRWWSMLKRRKALAKIKNKFPGSSILPNASIIVTQEQVDLIKEQYGYDLSAPYIVQKLMEHFFLISFIIIDPAMQRASFMFDGHQEYELYTYATLAKEVNTTDKQYKEMMKMMGGRI